MRYAGADCGTKHNTTLGRTLQTYDKSSLRQ